MHFSVFSSKHLNSPLPFIYLFLSFLTDTEKVMYFSLFSPKYLNSPLHSFATSLIME